MVLLESESIEMGAAAPDFSLKASDGKTYELGSFESKKILVVVFMCNHCPYVQAIWGRLVKLQKKFQDDSVQFVGINPNLNPDYPEESLEKMAEYYQEYSMNFPYLQDESQEVARAYGAVCTPDIFVYDEERLLRYHGRIDDNWQDEAGVTAKNLEEAIGKMVQGQVPDVVQYPSMGCSIKWRE